MITLTDVQKVPLSISATDAAGNPAPLESPVWSSSDEALLTVAAGADGLSAVATTVGPLGTAQVRVTADARIGPEVLELNGVLDVEIVASEATAIGIAAGAPESRL